MVGKICISERLFTFAELCVEEKLADDRGNEPEYGRHSGAEEKKPGNP
jgi:hypothetical protein